TRCLDVLRDASALYVWFHRTSNGCVRYPRQKIPFEKWKSLALVVILDVQTLHTRGESMFRRAVFVVALGGLFLLPAHDRIDRAWNAVGGGFTWINYVDVHRVSAYISKYLTKALLDTLPSKKKRISTSRGIRLFQKSRPTGWWHDRGSIQKHYQFAMNS